MGLDSITQTLSNPDCGLSKPHIPDNTPYISHRLIHSNRQGPHPQINHMTCLSFSLIIATICLPFSTELYSSCFHHPFRLSPLCYICHLLSLSIQFAQFLSQLLQFTLSCFVNALSNAVPLSLAALQCSL